MPQVNMSDELLDECQKLLYSAWATAFDNHTHVKAEKNDGSADWEDFHLMRLNNAKEDEATLQKLLKELNAVAPLTRKRTT